jgi:hypothetical protein
LKASGIGDGSREVGRKTSSRMVKTSGIGDGSREVGRKTSSRMVKTRLELREILDGYNSKLLCCKRGK